MKRFWRTIGGKVILFLTVIVCFYAVIGSAIGVYVMANWSSDFYSSSEEALQKDMIDFYAREQVQRKLLPYVYGDELPSTEDGGTSLRYRISIAHIVGSTEVSSNHFNGVQAKMANLAYTYYYAKGVYHNAEDGWIDLLELSEQEVQTLAPGSEYYNCTLAEIYTVEAYVDDSVQVIDRVYLIREIVHIAYAMRYRIVIVAAAAFVLGLVAGIVLYCLGIPSMMIGLGVYLPFYMSLSAPIGAAVKLVYDKLAGGKARSGELDHNDTGIVVASGLLGGESIVGVIIALVTVVTGLLA